MDGSEGADARAGTAVVDAAGRVEGMRLTLATIDPSRLDDAARLELLRSLEDLTRSTAALAVRSQVCFRDSQVAGQARGGVPVTRRGLAVADDLAAARKTSPYWGSRDLTSARALVDEMPRTLAALEVGTISAFQARTITEVTTCLDPGDRAEVDERLEGSLAGASNGEIAKMARALVYEVDPAGFVSRARRAAKDRGVSSRPAPDVMAVLSARLPAAQAVACYRVLHDHAITARASGDPRTLNQLMADTLVERLTGRAVVDGIDVEVGLLITDDALFDGASDAADLEDYGPIPAQTARDLLGSRPESASAEHPGDDPTGQADDSGWPNDDTTPRQADDVHDPADDASQICPEGPRCMSWDCGLFHGVPDAGAGAPGRALADPATSDPDPDPEPVVPDPEPVSPSPATLGRSAAAAADDGGSAGARAAKAWLRRLYADPVTGVLAVRDPRRRAFTGALRAFLVARDRTCRNSWCGAPVRDIDHAHRHRDGGPTTEDNGRGLCRRCNLARERERFKDPPAVSYRPPPPAMHTLTGRRPGARPVPAGDPSPGKDRSSAA